MTELPADVELQRARMRVVALETLLAWLTTSHRRLLAVAVSDVRSRALSAASRELQISRQEIVDLAAALGSGEDARLQASMFREAFDEEAEKIEKQSNGPVQRPSVPLKILRARQLLVVVNPHEQPEHDSQRHLSSQQRLLPVTQYQPP